MKILIIKLGALGDVIRTTPVLELFSDIDEILWITEENALGVLPSRVHALSVEQSGPLSASFDLVLSLDDDRHALEIAANHIKAGTFIGAYLDPDGNPKYSLNSASWFDMSLISRFGKQTADHLKRLNKETWQSHLFGMLGKPFRGEEYCLASRFLPETNVIHQRPVIGLEARAGERWPTKRWSHFAHLEQRLRKNGYDVKWLQQRDTLSEYIEDIAACTAFVCGDTLGLHIALWLKIPTVGLFTCTSPDEIASYGCLVKVTSSKLKEAFYKQEYVSQAVEAITVDDVYTAFKQLGI